MFNISDLHLIAKNYNCKISYSSTIDSVGLYTYATNIIEYKKYSMEVILHEVLHMIFAVTKGHGLVYESAEFEEAIVHEATARILAIRGMDNTMSKIHAHNYAFEAKLNNEKITDKVIDRYVRERTDMFFVALNNI